MNNNEFNEAARDTRSCQWCDYLISQNFLQAEKKYVQTFINIS